MKKQIGKIEIAPGVEAPVIMSPKLTAMADAIHERVSTTIANAIGKRDAVIMYLMRQMGNNLTKSQFKKVEIGIIKATNNQGFEPGKGVMVDEQVHTVLFKGERICVFVIRAKGIAIELEAKPAIALSGRQWNEIQTILNYTHGKPEQHTEADNGDGLVQHGAGEHSAE